MLGMQSMTVEEMRSVKGGYCKENSYQGTTFCCPGNKKELQGIVEYMQRIGRTDMAAAFVKFCYEDCGMN